MIRVDNLESSLDFWTGPMGLIEMRRMDSETGKFTLVFLAAPDDVQAAETKRAPELELTYNWDTDERPRTQGRAWGHLCYTVPDIYTFCQNLIDHGITINRPPRDGKMAFIKSPEDISIELIQEGEALPQTEPWVSMDNTGTW